MSHQCHARTVLGVQYFCRRRHLFDLQTGSMLFLGLRLKDHHTYSGTGFHGAQLAMTQLAASNERFQIMFKSSLTTGILSAALATTLSTPSLAAEGTEDFYVGGIAVVLLTDQFSPPAGANLLGANLPFPSNPFTPIM